MKLSDSFFLTRREYPKDEDTISSKLLIKSGMILKNSNGVYSYLPLGLKVLNNIKNIIKDEMNKIKASEILLPSLVSSDVYSDNTSDRLTEKEVYKIVDRNKRSYNLCTTSEELFSYLASFKIQSYKDLHFSLYQFSNKYRDEEKVEYGLIRKKEFYTMDACSFDSNEGGLDVSYDKMFLAFKNVFSNLLLDTIIVESDPSNKNGILSEEFQILSEYGDNEIVKCSSCTYACNLEDASNKSISIIKDVKQKKKTLTKTVNKKSIKELSDFLDVFPEQILKSLIVKVDGQYKMILLKGNSELNIKKLKRLFKTDNITIPDVYELEKIGTCVGYIGPVDCTMEIIADNEVKNMHNFICGSNKKDYHYINVNYGRDFKINRFADLKLFDEYSLCPKCRNKCTIEKGIEVGQIYKIGTSYSDLHNLTYTDEVNKDELVFMGSYQIGLDRCISAIVENNHDDKGIIWPISVAPYKVAIIVGNINDKESLKYANNLYDKLNSLNIETILDDRKETIGVKFNDIDLIGIPIRITIGRKISDNIVELKLRREDTMEEVETSKIIEKIESIIENDN